MDMYYAWKITDDQANNDLVGGRKKKKRKTRNEVGKGNGKSDEAEEFYTLRRSQPATMAKSD
jgi:hypothetical protein